MNGFRPDNRSSADIRRFSSNVSDVPAEVDWRKKGCVTHVKDQVVCSNIECLAFKNIVNCSTFYGIGPLE